MHASIKRVGIFTGATIMGDGRVALIADVAGIVEHARLSFDSAVESASKAADARKSAQAHRVLLFEYGPHEQFALPLLQIRRIEMVGRDRVERVGETRIRHGGRRVDADSATRQGDQRLRTRRGLGRVGIADVADPAEVRRSADGDPGVADRGHRIVVGRLAGTSGTGSRHSRLGGRARPADALPGYPPAVAEVVRQVVASPDGSGFHAAAQAAAPDRRHTVFPRGRQALSDGGRPRGRDRRQWRGCARAAREGPRIRPDRVGHRDAGHGRLGVRPRSAPPRRQDADARPDVAQRRPLRGQGERLRLRQL